MRAQAESRSGTERRQSGQISVSFLDIERRGNKDQRSHVVREEDIYGSTATLSDDYWETLSGIPSEDCR